MNSITVWISATKMFRNWALSRKTFLRTFQHGRRKTALVIAEGSDWLELSDIEILEIILSKHQQRC